MKTLGILGGMGVQATSAFYAMLTRLQSVTHEQDYMDVIIYSKPSIPDRTAFITGQSDNSPLASLVAAAKVLENAGAGLIAMPCVTAHFFYDELIKTVEVPFVNMLDETASHLHKSGYTTIGLLATKGTLDGQMFHRAFDKRGIKVITPPQAGQASLSRLIYRLKRGELPEGKGFRTSDGCGQKSKESDIASKCGSNFNLLDSLSFDLHSQGAQAIVLGCTELGLLKQNSQNSKYMYIEAMEVLAKAVLERHDNK